MVLTAAMTALAPAALALPERKLLPLPPGVVHADGKLLAEMLGLEYMPLPTSPLLMAVAKTGMLHYTIDAKLGEVYYDTLAECIRRDLMIGASPKVTHFHSLWVGKSYHGVHRIIFVCYAKYAQAREVWNKGVVYLPYIPRMVNMNFIVSPEGIR